VSEQQGRQDAEHLKLLSIFHYVVGAMMALFGCFPIIHLLIGLAMVSGKLGHAKAGEPFPALFGWAFVLLATGFILTAWTLAVCTVVAGRNLSRRRRYLFCLIVAGVMAATCMPFGTVLGVFTILVLMRPSVKQIFGVQA
jgi:hypothetical protein